MDSGARCGKETVTKIRARIKELAEPSFLNQIDVRTCPEGKRYIVLEGTGSDTPYSCDGRYYVRNAKSDDRAENVLLRRMLQNREFDLMREADSVGISLMGAKKIVGVLMKAGLLARKGSKKTGKWVIVK